MWPSLETTPKTITVAGNFVFIPQGTSLLFVAIQICILRMLAMVPLSLLGSVESLSCTAAHLRSRSWNIVSHSDNRRLLLHNWLTSRWSATTKKKNRFSLNENGIMSSFLGRQFYRSTLYNPLIVCKQMCSVSFENVINKLYDIYKSFNMYL